MKIYQQLRGIAAERGCEEKWSTGGSFQKYTKQNKTLIIRKQQKRKVKCNEIQRTLIIIKP